MVKKKTTKKPASKQEIPALVEMPSPESAPAQAPAFSFPVVGIGASAGGLAAFEAFFSGMPAETDPGMAFVLVQHLAPDHKSILTDLIRRYTRMQVFEVEDGMVVHPNCTYIIPPGRDMAFLNGTLHLLEQTAPRGQRMPIDFFFRSLAQDQHEQAICVVLSGTGSDGTLGVRAIKGEGGMVMVQNPASTEYDGMPRSAIATGLVDYELPPAEMPAQIISYVAHAFGRPLRAAMSQVPTNESALKKIFILLRAQTNHDFSQYKSGTITRRIERRMAVHQINTLDSYVKYAQQNPPEVEALFSDLLIGVTNFFRDPEAFKALQEQVIPKIFAGKTPETTIRVWSTGCSTGEEAYSLAILLAEHQELLKKSYTIQVFATDIDRRAIAAARAGIYPAGIAADLSNQRLARFFTAEPGGSAYRIHKGIRDMLVFSEHNLIKDPPFSKLDLISCRNLMIYFSGDLQKKLMPIFHYALNPGGFLLLGTSETVGGFDDLFVVQDHKSRLYMRKDDFYSAQRANLARITPPMTAMQAGLPQADKKTKFPAKLPLRELTEEALLQEVVSCGALVDAHGNIFYLHGRTGMYLEPAPGETMTSNIRKMAREGLRNELTTALYKAKMTKEKVLCPGLRVKTNDHFTMVNLTICPVRADAAKVHEEPLYLVILNEMPGSDSEQAVLTVPQVVEGADHPSSNGDSRYTTLLKELRAKEEYLQATVEELETSCEELKSSNEEMQSLNEESQSTNEELETSKEELQSVNEELATVNSELQTKVADLSRANDDMNNLLSGTGIATIFLDYSLHIMRYTPFATQIINLILSDVGRPVAHVVTNLVGYTSLVADTQAVLDTLVPKEFEVQTSDGKWYSMRIRPYRTIDNVIEGAVLTFSDITEAKQVKEDLRKANDLLRLAVVVRDASDAITVKDLRERIIAWNPGAVRMYGWTETEALMMNVRDRIPKELISEEMTVISQLAKSQILKPYRTHRLAKDGTELEVWLTATALVDADGQMYAIATTERAATPGDVQIIETKNE